MVDCVLLLILLLLLRLLQLILQLQLLLLLLLPVLFVLCFLCIEGSIGYHAVSPPRRVTLALRLQERLVENNI